MKSMKLQPILMLAISISLLTASCTDPCENVICENDGICMDGVCVCIGDYTSADCTFTPSEIEWEKSFGGSGIDQAYSIQQTLDEGYIVAGKSESSNGDVGGNKGEFDYWILKLDKSGNIEWEKNYGGSENDEAYSIQQTLDEGYIVGGNSRSLDGDVGTTSYPALDYWIIKLDKSGNIEWEKIYGGSHNEELSSIKQTLDGGYIVSGLTWSSKGIESTNNGENDYWILKLDSSGELEWEKSYGGSKFDLASSIQQTTDGGYIVGGRSKSDDGQIGENYGNFDYWIIKLNDKGIIEWEKNYGGSKKDYFRSIQQTKDGGFIIVGGTGSKNNDVNDHNGDFDYWVLKIDTEGSIEWEKTYGGSKLDEAWSVDQTLDDGYVVLGYSRSKNKDVIDNYCKTDYWLIKLDETGNLQWGKNYGGSKWDTPQSIKQTSDSGYIMVGYSNSSNGDVSENNGFDDYWVVKLAPE